MSRIARIVIPDMPHHITQRGVRSMNVFFSPEDYHLYKKLLQEQCERSWVKIVAYCLMTNHVHLIAVPAREESLAKAIGEAHRLYARFSLSGAFLEISSWKQNDISVPVHAALLHP